jgi:nitrogen fixation NifU-like protein
VAEELGGLPKNKLHCSNLGADALHAAIEDYRAKSAPGVRKQEAAPAHAHGEHGEISSCPYCDGPLEGMEEMCACSHYGVDFVECPECGQYTNKADDACVACGAKIAK